MAQAQKKPKQPQDRHAQQGKQLTSSVQRLRGWVGSDPARAPELADALVQLTRHRLSGHAYAAAAGDAQESVVRSAQLLTANGPIGPYTSIGDATRYVTALVHLAGLQFGLGVPNAASRTLTSLQDIQQQLRGFQIEEQLEPLDSIWELCAAAAARLASGDVPEANTYADDALARLAASSLSDEAGGGFLAMDIDRLVSDCRWAAGRSEEALTSLHSAKARYDDLVGGRLREPGRLSPALMERLAEPVFGLYRDMADRLRATGESDLGLVTRWALVDLLRGLSGRLGDASRRQLASALADLANDLSAVDRLDEADACVAEASALVLGGPGAESTRVLVAAARARVLTLVGRPAEAVTLLGQVLPTELAESPTAAYAMGLRALADALRAEGDVDAASSTEAALGEIAQTLTGRAEDDGAGRAVEDLARGVVSRGTVTAAEQETAAWLAAERAAARQLELDRRERARVEAERRAAEQAEAVRIAAQQRAVEQARAEERARLEAERQSAAEEAERLERKRRREERLEQHRLEVEQREAERREAERLEAERMSADPAETERLELERLQAELLDLERADEPTPAEPDLPADEPSPPEEPVEIHEPADAEPVAPEPIAPEPITPEPITPEPAAPEPIAPEPAAPEPIAPEPAAPEPVVAEPLAPEPVDELALAQQSWRDAKTRGERKAARAANERVVELLRPRAQADLAGYGPQLYDALVELSSARLRGGDIWGSRSPAKEAKALAKTLGR